MVEKPIRVLKQERTPKATITTLECGCKIYLLEPDILDIICKRVPDPLWIRCPKHLNSKPEEIVITFEGVES